MHEFTERRMNFATRGSSSRPTAVECELFARVIRRVDNEAECGPRSFAEKGSLTRHCARSPEFCCCCHRAVQGTVLNLLDGFDRSDRLNVPIDDLLGFEL